MTTTTKPNRLIRFVLLGSLALNVMMLGLAGGAYFNNDKRPPRGIDVQLGSLSNALSQEDRREIGLRIRSEMRGNGIMRAERMAAFADLIAIVQADPFDANALASAIRAQQTRQDALRKTALDAFVAHIAEMMPAERTTFAENLKRSSERHGDGRRPPPPPEASGG